MQKSTAIVSTAIVARAVVIIACLVSLPLVALFGSSLPELAAKLLDSQLEGQATSPDITDEIANEAPQFRPEASVTAWSEPEGNRHGEVILAGSTGASGREIPVDYQTPDIPPYPGSSGTSLGQASPIPAPSDDGRFEARGPAPAAPPGDSTGAVIRPPSDTYPTDPAAALSSVPQTASATGTTFELTQQRLQDLGAVYYRLESWGSGQQLFRFQCEMAVGDSQGLTRHFESVDRNPLLAMRKVLAEAEAWHASR